MYFEPVKDENLLVEKPEVPIMKVNSMPLLENEPVESDFDESGTASSDSLMSRRFSGVEDNTNTATLPYEEKTKWDQVDQVQVRLPKLWSCYGKSQESGTYCSRQPNFD